MAKGSAELIGYSGSIIAGKRLHEEPLNAICELFLREEVSRNTVNCVG